MEYCSAMAHVTDVAGTTENADHFIEWYWFLWRLQQLAAP